MSKRKAESSASAPPPKRPAIADHVRAHFRKDLFEPRTLDSFKSSYADSEPYKHGVIQSLIQPTLLRDVRSEITEHVSFTPKETDIYKIHQSGDLANLDGLDPSALKLLPSLVKLRDAMYSRDFREYLSEVTGAGKLSGKKTDMAVNVYTPGCHLLCHDDVIGSRRVSYILYLMDPDKSWHADWGGALRLYPTNVQQNKHGETVAVPEPNHTVSIPPAFSQLSFFAVQPGLSYHDVEEVYAQREGEPAADDGGRVRMAISGWYHIPQEGEEGYEEGAEEKQAEKSSLAQLQGKADEFEEPRSQWIDPIHKAKNEILGDGKTATDDVDVDNVELTEQDLEFLIKYMNPRYLTPETVDILKESFTDESSLQLSMFLCSKFETPLKQTLSDKECKVDTDTTGTWHTARPPHKHRYLYEQASVVPSPSSRPSTDETSVSALLHVLLPSLAFRKWLSLVTGLSLGECDVLARRFRRGKDYSLATKYNDEDPQLEICLGLTPTDGWVANDEEETKNSDAAPSQSRDDPSVGGYEAYLAGDEDDDCPAVDAQTNPSSATGAGQRRGAKADPAVYQAKGEDEEEDDGVLFTQPASWNTLTIVLRDKGTLRFVKYVSRSAPGDRWDVSGAWRVAGTVDDEDGDENSDGEGEEASEDDDGEGEEEEDSESDA